MIKTESEYDAAIVAIEDLIDLDPDPGTLQADELKVLALLIGAYENEINKDYI